MQEPCNVTENPMAMLLCVKKICSKKPFGKGVYYFLLNKKNMWSVQVFFFGQLHPIAIA